MSLHQKPTEEVEKKIKGQKTASLIFSIVAAVVIIGALGGVLYKLKQYFFEPPNDVTITIAVPQPTIDQDQPQKKTPPPVVEELEELISADDSPISIDVPEPVEQVDVEFTSEFTDDFSEEFAEEFVDGVESSDSDFTPSSVPPGIQQRCTREDRLKKIQENGGDPKSEDAVDVALAWLAANQNADGSWSNGQDQVAMTSLALLSFFGRCETPFSPNYGSNVRDALDFVVKRTVAVKGSFVPRNDRRGSEFPTYTQGIVTYALCEAYTFLKELDYQGSDNLKEAVHQAVATVIDGQNNNGGWVYGYDYRDDHPEGKKRGGSDASVSSWAMQALKAAKYTKLEWDGLEEAISKGVENFKKHQIGKGAISYQLGRNDSTLGLTAAGALVLQQHKAGKSQISQAIKYYVKNMEPLDYAYGGGKADIYEHYYATQALMNQGGREWRDYNKVFLPATLANQDTDGSFKVPPRMVHAPGGLGAGQKGKIYTTTMSLLMLEVYYRFLPTLQ